MRGAAARMTAPRRRAHTPRCAARTFTRAGGAHHNTYMCCVRAYLVYMCCVGAKPADGPLLVLGAVPDPACPELSHGTYLMISMVYYCDTSDACIAQKLCATVRHCASSSSRLSSTRALEWSQYSS